MLEKIQGSWWKRIGQTKTVLGEKVREALTSVLPITLIVLILCFTIAPVPSDVLLAFLVGAVLLIVGMGLFTLGADTAMLPIGERVGAQMTKSRKLWVVILVSFLIGMIVTISEPDLQVLAGQVPGIPNAVLIGAVAAGVGTFLVVALLRILFQIPLNGLLIVSYLVIFTLTAFAPEDFLAVAFDSGGVTTGPMTVPFIMALGMGVSSTRSDGKAGEDSFGLVALCSVGPVLAVLILSLLYPAAGSYVPAVVPEAGNSRELWGLFAYGLPVYAKEMGAALAPIAAFFAIFQMVSLRLPRKSVLKIVVGLLYTYIGLILFMTGVNVGFLPAGTYLGQQIAALDQRWVLIPIGMLMGWFIVQAEPAVHVLTRQVEELTSGAIPGKAMSTSLSIGVAVSIGLAMLRVLAVLILSLLYPAAGSYVPAVVPEAGNSRELWGLFAYGLPVYAKEMGAALAPIAAFFAIFQMVSLRLPRKSVLKIVVGLLYTYIGLILFMTGVNVGFLPAGTYLGQQIAALDQRWVLIPIGMLMGWFIVQAEPAVHVLTRQVEELTSGAIPGKAMSTSLSIGVAVSIGLAMLRVLTGISIFVLLVPGYLCAITLSFIVPKIFTAIAFDSGGVASGPMTATFLLPFAMGACEMLGGNVVTDAFGVVAMVAMTPLITIQLLGLVYKRKLRKTAASTAPAPAIPAADDEIIDL